VWVKVLDQALDQPQGQVIKLKEILAQTLTDSVLVKDKWLPQVQVMQTLKDRDQVKAFL
jgi:hypothetical protein